MPIQSYSISARLVRTFKSHWVIDYYCWLNWQEFDFQLPLTSPGQIFQSINGRWQWNAQVKLQWKIGSCKIMDDGELWDMFWSSQLFCSVFMHSSSRTLFHSKWKTAMFLKCVLLSVNRISKALGRSKSFCWCCYTFFGNLRSTQYSQFLRSPFKFPVLSLMSWNNGWGYGSKIRLFFWEIVTM